jgi:hypothetical protein
VRSSRSSLGEGRRVKSGEKARDAERVKDKPNADGGFLEAEVRGSTWLALVPHVPPSNFSPFCATERTGQSRFDIGRSRPFDREIARLNQNLETKT